MLGIHRVDAMRRFWYGDVFIVKFSEHPKTFAFTAHDTPALFLEHPSIEKIFQSMWAEEFLEDQLSRDRYHGAWQEKMEADKALIFQRMSVCSQEISCQEQRSRER